MKVQQLLPLTHITQSPTPRHKLLKRLLRIILCINNLQNPHIIRTITPNRILALIRIVHILLRPERAYALHVCGDVAHSRVHRFTYRRILGRVVPEGDEDALNNVVFIFVETGYVPAVIKASLRSFGGHWLVFCKQKVEKRVFVGDLVDGMNDFVDANEDGGCGFED